jgi:death-on-curing family protein
LTTFWNFTPVGLPSTAGPKACESAGYWTPLSASRWLNSVASSCIKTSSEMAAALHFSLVLNHAFVDGNKRTDLLAAVTLLDVNGHAIEYPSGTLFDITRNVAAGSATKEQVAAVFRELAAQSAARRTSRWRRWLGSFVRLFRSAR